MGLAELISGKDLKKRMNRFPDIDVVRAISEARIIESKVDTSFVRGVPVSEEEASNAASAAIQKTVGFSILRRRTRSGPDNSHGDIPDFLREKPKRRDRLNNK